MTEIIILVFVGIFVAIGLPVLAFALVPTRKTTQALTALDSALTISNQAVAAEQAVDFRKESRLSSIPWLNRKLQAFDLAPYLNRTLSQAKVNWSLGRLLVMTAAGFAIPGYLVYLRLESFLFSMLAGLLLGLAPFGWVLMKRARRFRQFEEALPEALDLMVSALRAGHSLIASMGLVSRECPEPVGSEFKTCYEEQNYGLELKSAIDNLLFRIPLQDLRIVATAIMIQKESGGNLAEVLDKTSSTIRERFRLKRQVMVHTAQGRLTGLILTFLPVALGIALYLVNPDMMSVLWKRPIGIKLLWASGGLTVLGGLIIHRIVNMDI